MKKLMAAAAITLLLSAGACSDSEDSKDGLSAKERSDLDNAAMMLEGNQIIDTSADSLVLDENAADPGMPAENGAAANENASANQAPPR